MVIEQQQIVRATVYYANKLYKKCLSSWQHYIAHRRISKVIFPFIVIDLSATPTISTRSPAAPIVSVVYVDWHACWYTDFDSWKNNFILFSQQRHQYQQADTLFAKRMLPTTFTVCVVVIQTDHQAWSGYVQYRRNKHEMYKTLLTWRKQDLTRQGVRWMIKVTTQLY